MEVQALSDRMTHDTFLVESVHRMLTRVAAIRSAAEILTEYPDAPADRRDQFLEIVSDESRVLTDVCEALSAYFDKARESNRALTPLDEVEALFEARDNHFDSIELEAASLTGLLDDGTPAPRRALARALAAERLGPLIDAIIAGEPEIQTTRARDRARAALLDYATGAILAPMPAFRPRAAALRYDIEALAASFALEVETVCQRLVALSGEGAPRFGYFRANAAGTIVERRGLPRLVAPRYAPACPLWVLYRAQQSPEAVIRQRALFPNGDRFVFIARAHNTGPTGFGKPRHYLTDMLAMTEADAGLTVYAPERRGAGRGGRPRLPHLSAPRLSAARRRPDVQLRRFHLETAALPSLRLAPRSASGGRAGGGTARWELRVQLVEDEPNIVVTLTYLLERAGFDVSTETDGEAALTAALADPPAVMILDVALPGSERTRGPASAACRRLAADTCR